MRILGGMVLVLLLPGGLMAAPEPPPPGDYPGAQYIDRTGCVFVRQESGWVPRVDGQDAPICGFPPSQSAQPAPQDAPAPSPESILADVLSQGLRSGDLLTDPPAEPLAQVAPDPAQADLDAALAKQIELDARLRNAMTGGAPDGLCARLGYRNGGGSAPIVGGDVTQGLCPGMTATDPAPRIVAAASPTPVIALPAPEGEAVAETRTARPRPQATMPTRRSLAVSEKPAPVAARRPAAPQAERQSLVEMIPANARYVQIGTYGDDGNALAALRRLSQLGYRTAQSRESRDGGTRKAILAGPFGDRQALVSALTRLRASGYPRAVAR
ncbi:SPOR domain-containing protein [Paracoccus sediminis]|uniref:SPOR domain-containing protein n=1 Tax=Paracoccus sediminis TaxID=1214787 RepID=A0A238X0N3_9RHOB|nr:SPOR domain-containing protein [Paracoccus sediminis]TBN49330.1 SPOR domain-containing protein [Paracoccus sediminis]SNR52515.1 Sporulation related domain-containing protein [Paracoccus sediminis]